MNSVSLQNRKIIGEAYAALKPQLFSIFRQAGIDECDCDDLVHDVFLKLLNIDIIAAEHLKGLAVTMAYQKRTDYLRHQAYIFNEQAQIVKMYVGTACCQISTDINIILNAEKRIVFRMNDLDVKTYSMSRYEEKTADEIAQTLNISKRAVEARLYRMRLVVREKLRKIVNI